MNHRKGLFPSEEQALLDFFASADYDVSPSLKKQLSDIPFLCVKDLKIFNELLKFNCFKEKVIALKKADIDFINWNYIFNLLNFPGMQSISKLIHKEISKNIILHVVNDYKSYMLDLIRNTDEGVENLVKLDEIHYCICVFNGPKSLITSKLSSEIDMKQICAHGLMHALKVSSYLNENQLKDYLNQFSITKEEDIYHVLTRFEILLNTDVHAIVSIRRKEVDQNYVPILNKYKAIMIEKEKLQLGEICTPDTQSKVSHRI